MKFSLEKVVTAQDNKRPAEQQPVETRRSKIFKASDVVVEDGPKPAAAGAKKYSSNAPVNLVIYKVTDKAGDVWERYKDQDGVPLWMVQISQDSARPITYQFRDRFSDFLRVTEGAPDNLQDLQEKCGYRLVVGDRNDALTDLFARMCVPHAALYMLSFV